MRPPSRSKGFTLIEVIISITILAFISVFTGRMIQQGIKARRKIQTEMDRSSALRATLSLMVQDIHLAFNYRDIHTELYNAAQTERRNKAIEGKKPGQGNNPGNPGSGNPNPGNPPGTGNGGATSTLTPEEEKKYQTKEVVIVSNFIGERDKLSFTSLNNFRATQNIQQSDQAEIGYEIKNCSRRIGENTQTSECLWRRISSYIDDEVKEGGKESVLLENVKSVQFRYLGPGHLEKWAESWKSKGGEEVMKGNFPTAVEITLTIFDNNFKPPKELAMTVVAPVFFPNNKETKDEKGSIVH